jgi:hypothetical protein
MTQLEDTFKDMFFAALEGVGGAEDLAVSIGGGDPVIVRGHAPPVVTSEDVGMDATFSVSTGTVILPLPACAGLSKGDTVQRVRGDDGQTYKVDLILSRGGGMIQALVRVGQMKDLYNNQDRAKRGGGR